MIAAKTQPIVENIEKATNDDSVTPTSIPTQSTTDNDIINEIPNKEQYSTSELNRIGACLLVKKEGNEFFSKGEYRKAIESYEKLTRFMGVLLKGEKHLSDPMKVTVDINTALCHIKLEEYSHAVTCCDNAIEIDSKNVKAYYRRGVAKMEMAKYEEAQSDFNRVLELDPDNKSAKQMLQQMKILLKERDRKGKQMYGGLFNKTELYEDKKVYEESKKDTLSTTKAEEPGNSLTLSGLFSWQKNKSFWISFMILFPLVAGLLLYVVYLFLNSSSSEEFEFTDSHL
jgi:tetratricopeptide (TPR) repeat protein